MKLLTIVTVTYNAAECIEKTLQSVVGQTAFDEQIEYILVDGGSKDATMEIVRRYESKLARTLSERDHGIFDAMNKGAKLATAPWICFMNAGDTFVDTEVVSNLLLEHIPADRILYGDCIRVYADSRKQDYRTARPFFEHRNEICGVGICHQSVIQPTHLMQQHPFRWEEFPHCADFDFLWRMYEQQVPFEYLRRAISFYDYGQGFSSDRRNNRIVFDENARIAHLKYSWAYWKNQIRHYLFRK